MCERQYSTEIGPKQDNNNNNAFRERHDWPVLVLMQSDFKNSRLNHTHTL